MGVVVADRAIDLAEQLHPGDGRPGTTKAIGSVGHFLAERRRRCRLAMRTRHHRQIGQLVCEFPQPGDRPVKRRQHRFVTRRLQHQGVRRLLISSEVHAK
jgi:hypothetical protein